MDDFPWHTYAALGDRVFAGFCLRLSTILDGHARLHGRRLRFSDLTTNDSRIRTVNDQHTVTAIRMGADLVSVTHGSHDMMAPRADPDALAADLELGVRALAAGGAHVLLTGCFDPQLGFVPAPIRSRAAAFNANVWSIARSTGCTVLDLWSMREFQHPSMWSPDRTRISVYGERVLAARAAHALHVPYAEVPPNDRPAGAGHRQRTADVGGHQ